MISFKSHSGIYTLETEQELPIDLQTAWDFFSAPDNLDKITPESMGFDITSGASKSMYPGQIITYKVAPFPGVKSNWVTEITHVEDLKFFVDEQRFGPYSMWHHEHAFKATENGILMTDKISYKVPFGILGRMIHPFLIKGKLTQIFSYRFKILREIFPS